MTNRKQILFSAFWLTVKNVFIFLCFLDAAAGATDDWAKGTMGAEIVFTTELRDTGRYGFLLPPEYIIPSGEEFMAAFVAAANKVING